MLVDTDESKVINKTIELEPLEKESESSARAIEKQLETFLDIIEKQFSPFENHLSI